MSAASTTCGNRIPRPLPGCNRSWTNIRCTARPTKPCICWGNRTKAKSRGYSRMQLGAEQAPGMLGRNVKAYFVQEFTKHAADAYDRVITRYPLMEWSDSAKARLEALHQPVPKPTKAAVAQNKAEEDSRKEDHHAEQGDETFAKHPDVAEAAKVGEPTMVDPTPVSASGVLQQAAQAVAVDSAGASKSVSIETVSGSGGPAPNENAPRSDAPPTPAPDAGTAADPAKPTRTLRPRRRTQTN